MGRALLIICLACGMMLTATTIAETTTPIADTQKECRLDRTIRVRVQCSYLLCLPQDYGKDRGKRWPLVLFLHGMGAKASDGGPPKMVAEGRQFPLILVSPQCPESSHWVLQTDVLEGLLDEIETKYRVDRSRIYLTGLSMGGFGTWALAAKLPNRFAAIAPICGGGNPKDAALIKDIPMWVFHGDKDTVVPLSRSQEMVDAVKAAGGNPKFTIYPGVDHDAWTATYNSSEFWEWLLDQRRH